jgi:hypothetical protein
VALKQLLLLAAPKKCALVTLFAALGGVPKFAVCDNLESAVIGPDRHEPGLAQRRLCARAAYAARRSTPS